MQGEAEVKPPLELTVYASHEVQDGAHAVSTVYDSPYGPVFGWSADCMGRRKRLTDAELAAEYHAMDALLTHSEGAALFIAVQRMDRLRTLRRFATHPHYDEED